MTSAVTSTPAGTRSGNPEIRGIWKVIAASSVGTMIEWYDFYIFGSLAAIISTEFFPGGNPTAPFDAPRTAFGQRSSNDLQVDMSAAAIASVWGSRPIPNPSSTTRTIGRGRVTRVLRSIGLPRERSR